jgi:hypothetical protein
MDVTDRIATSENGDFGFSIGIDPFDALTERSHIGIELSALVVIKEPKLLHLLGFLQFLEPIMDTCFQVSQRSAKALLLGVAFRVHTSTPLIADLVGSGAECLFERRSDPVPLINIAVLNVPLWTFVAGRFDGIPGLTDIKPALATTHSYASRFDHFVQCGTVSAVHYHARMGNCDRFIHFCVANCRSMDLAIDCGSPDLGTKGTQATSNKGVTNVEIDEILVSAGHLGVEGHRETNLLDLVVQVRERFAP